MDNEEIKLLLKNCSELKDLVEKRCFHPIDLCKYLNIEYSENISILIRRYLKKENINLLYSKDRSRLSRLATLYKNDITHWWTNRDILEEVKLSLSNNLIINYADKDKKIARYVIAFKNHPRASKANQVKAHIILWELTNKQLFPENYVLIPNDGDFTNLDINNFKMLSNEDYRSLVATGKRNHFYIIGSTEGKCYKGGWKTISKQFLKNNKCAICGEEIQSKLNAHHIISYYLFDKPKDAHFNDNLICLCDSCHSKVHGKSINLLGYISEMRCKKLLELLETLKEKYKNTDLEQLVNFSIESISSQASDTEEGSTTIENSSK